MSESESITSESTLIPGPGPGGRQRTVENRQSVSKSESITSKSTLTPGPRDYQRTVKDRLQQTLSAAEQGLRIVSRRTRMHKWATNGAGIMLVLLGASAYLVAGIARGKQTNIGIMVLGGLVGFVGLFLAGARGFNEPEASRLRLLELGGYILDLRALMCNHGHRTWSGIGPEMQAMIVRKERRLKKIMGSRLDGLRALNLDEDDGRGSV